MTRLISMAFAFTFLASCGVATPPKPNVSGPIHTLGGGFLVSEGQLKYGMTYEAKSLPDPSYARAEFENPESREIPLKTDLGQLGLTSDIIVQSSLFSTIENHKNYWVVLYIYDDAAHTNLLHSHSDQVQFSMPSSLVSQLGLKEL